MRKKIVHKIFCGNTKSQLSLCGYLDISNDPRKNSQIPSNTNSRYYSLEPDCGFENRLAHNMARTVRFNKFYQEFLGAKLNGKKSSVKNVFENLGIPREIVLFFGSFEKYCSICYWKLPKIQSGRFG